MFKFLLYFYEVNAALKTFQNILQTQRKIYIKVKVKRFKLNDK